MDDDAIRDLFAGVAPVSIRKLFSGKGIYVDGMIVGCVMNGEVMLKADAVSGPEFAAAGATRWAYDGKGRPVNMPYWSVPVAAVDDPEEFAVWARKAIEAARRSAK